jgi:hypothetical protein
MGHERTSVPAKADEAPAPNGNGGLGGPPPHSEIAELELKQAAIQNDIKFTRHLVFPMFAGGVLVAAFGAFVTAKPIADLQRPVGLFILTSAALWLIGWWWFLNFRRATLQSEYDTLDARKRVIERFSLAPSSKGHGEPSYFDSLVRINVENLAAYYALVKVHTNKSFLISIGVGMVGFTLVGAGLVLGYSTSSKAHLAYVATGSGVITEFIAGVFFYLYNRTVRQLKEYHDSLLAVQNVLLAFRLVGDSTDRGEKSVMVGQMLAYLMRDRSHAAAPGLPGDGHQ